MKLGEDKKPVVSAFLSTGMDEPLLLRPPDRFSVLPPALSRIQFIVICLHIGNTVAITSSRRWTIDIAYF